MSSMKKTLGKLIASPYFSFAVTLILFVILYGAGIALYFSGSASTEV